MNVQPTPFPELTAMKKIKRIIVAMVGGTVLAVGLALVVLPGPAFLVIPAGLAILAMEFAWARRWLRKARGLLPKTKPRRKQETASSSPPVNYHRARAAASCRNAIPSTQTEIPHQPRTPEQT
jgi:tellurite resistance protein TerC